MNHMCVIIRVKSTECTTSTWNTCELSTFL